MLAIKDLVGILSEKFEYFRERARYMTILNDQD